MDRIINATLDKGAAQICGDLGMVISAEGIVMTNYTLEDFCANLSIEARPKFAQIMPNLNTLRFERVRINQQGAVPLEEIGIMHDMSFVMKIATDYANGFLTNFDTQNYLKVRRLYFDFLMLKQFEIQFQQDLAFVGFTFDETFLGRPQVYSELFSK